MYSWQNQLEEALSIKILQIEKFGGGFSNLTYAVTSNQGMLVLRTPPPGYETIKGGHDVVREYYLLKKLHDAGFSKIPTPIYVNEKDGLPFYAMEMVEGEILRATQSKDLLVKPHTFFRKRSEKLCLEHAALHKISLKDTGLDTFGKPEGYTERQISGWIKRYFHAETEKYSPVRGIIKWLETNIPQEIPAASLLHNDYKYDNTIFNDKDELVAILDWEMSTVGNPLMDLGATLAYWVEEKDEDFRKAFNVSWLPGNITRKEYVEIYARETNLLVDNILFYYVFGLFKNAVILQQLLYRFEKGYTSDQRFKNLAPGISILLSAAENSIATKQMA